MYDFDKTIYDGDSSVDFFMFCFKKGYVSFRNFLDIIGSGFKYISGVIDITKFKESVFGFLSNINNIDDVVVEFWDRNKYKIKNFYLDKEHDRDIINSAGPYFLLKPICDELGVMDLIASDVDKKCGKFISRNNSGDVKVVNFNNKYSMYKVVDVYSDSLVDIPILNLGINKFIVRGCNIIRFEDYKVNVIKALFKRLWLFYREHLEIINYLFVGGCTTVVSIGCYGLCRGCGIGLIVSNVISWVLAVVFAYFANRVFVFNSDNVNMVREFISFGGSRVITLVLDTLLMLLFVNYMSIDDLVSKIIVQIVVVIGNYVISKLFVFKK